MRRIAPSRLIAVIVADTPALRHCGQRIEHASRLWAPSRRMADARSAADEAP
jgi:hypothetical protein